MLKKLTRHIAGGLATGIFALGLVALVTVPVMAQRSFAARLFPTEQTHYLRFQISFNSCVPVALTCSFKVGSVPYNSFMVRAFTQTYTTFSGGGVTAYTVSFGTTAATTTELMALTTILTAGNAIAQTVAAGGLGTTVTGNGIAQSGTLGGFDIWARVTATTGYPTAGNAVGILEFIAPNDGACTAVSQGATAAGC
jgi:hypothetical protein